MTREQNPSNIIQFPVDRVRKQPISLCDVRAAKTLNHEAFVFDGKVHIKPTSLFDEEETFYQDLSSKRIKSIADLRRSIPKTYKGNDEVLFTNQVGLENFLLQARMTWVKASYSKRNEIRQKIEEVLQATIPTAIQIDNVMFTNEVVNQAIAELGEQGLEIGAELHAEILRKRLKSSQ